MRLDDWKSHNLIAAMLIGAGVVCTLHAQPDPLLPVDEAASRPEFFSFRAQLQRAIARRDLSALMAVVDTRIRNTFGDDNGIEAFRRLWRVDAPDSEIWHELGTVLALGGTFDQDGRFIAPYTFSRWDVRRDAFEHVALIGADVRVRAQPDPAAAVIGTMSFAILPVARPPQALEVSGWTAVRAGDRIAYVSSALARSPVDYRAIFARSGAGWRLVTFIAGD